MLLRQPEDGEGTSPSVQGDAWGWCQPQNCPFLGERWSCPHLPAAKPPGAIVTLSSSMFPKAQEGFGYLASPAPLGSQQLLQVLQQTLSLLVSQPSNRHHHLPSISLPSAIEQLAAGEEEGDSLCQEVPALSQGTLTTVGMGVANRAWGMTVEQQHTSHGSISRDQGKPAASPGEIPLLCPVLLGLFPHRTKKQKPVTPHPAVTLSPPSGKDQRPL